MVQKKIAYVCFVVFALLSNNVLLAQNIANFAGGGSGGLGDGGPATAGKVPLPAFCSFDAVGNLYFIEDYSSPRIRMVDTAGIITTIAGNGIPGYSGDSGLATNAKIHPEGTIVDEAGNIYFVDYVYNRVRKVDKSTGIIYTIGGTGSTIYNGENIPALSAGMDPSGITIDKHHNIYIIVYARIRKIDTAGIITTVAGNGTGGDTGDNGPADSAEIKSDYAICTDSIGNLYFGSNYKIRKVNINTGIITTIAGTGNGIYNGDGMHADSANIDPWALDFDKYGNLFIADYSNNRIRKIDTSGIIHTIAGDGTAAYGGDNGPAIFAHIWHPEGVAIDKCGNVFIADEANNRIRVVIYDSSCVKFADTINHDTSAYINNNTFVTNFIIHPNPVTNILYLENVKSTTEYNLLNSLGIVVQHGLLTMLHNALDLGELSPGIYYLQLTNDKKEKVFKKVIKQ